MIRWLKGFFILAALAWTAYMGLTFYRVAELVELSSYTPWELAWVAALMFGPLALVIAAARVMRDRSAP
jgi:hypothetical protein